MRVDGAPVERLSDAPARPLVSRVPARSAGADQGPAGAAPVAPRPGRRGDLARARGVPARRTRRRSRSATRCSRGSGPAAPRARRCRRGTRSSPATASRCATTGPRRSSSWPRRSPPPRASWASPARRRCATGRAARAPDAEALAAELAERVDGDLERGFTGHGPHRDDLLLSRDGRELRAYGSQGEQRMGLLALLLAERDVLADERGPPPLLLLDDVMSELDGGRRGCSRSASGRAGRRSSRRRTSAHVPGADRPGRGAAAGRGRHRQRRRSRRRSRREEQRALPVRWPAP